MVTPEAIAPLSPGCDFEVAAGSVAGRDHRLALKNSHDAVYVVQDLDVLAAVVCDGCGSSPHSEVGAKIGARLVVQQLLRWYHREPHSFYGGAVSDGLRKVRRSVLAQIQVLADSMGGSYSQAVSDHFLFTVVGILVTGTDTIIFSAGDGVYQVNGQPGVILDAGNVPDYMAYGIVDSSQEPQPFQVCAHIPTTELESVVLGTDGAAPFIRTPHLTVPGKSGEIGRLSQFVEKDLYFRNPAALGRRLNVVNRDWRSIDYEKKEVKQAQGRLPDDTTILAVRRRPK